MKPRRLFPLLLATIFLGTAVLHAADDPFAWPPITAQQKPWAFNWWMGSAVDKTNLTKELERYAAAGLGGIHIIPIYGAKGFEDKYINYLSPQWMEMMGWAVSESRRLGMDCDMTTGSGWCFGGPTVSEADGTATIVSKTFQVAGSAKIAEKIDKTATQILMAFPENGAPQDLTKSIRDDGSVDWTAPEGSWTVYAISQAPSLPNVKRPAPGGAGRMLNLLNPAGMPAYLERFSKAFASYTGEKPRAMYHDSYEYNSNWSPSFLTEFQKRRGYKLQTELPALLGSGEDPDHVARVKSDYRQTISELITDDGIATWTKWSHDHGFITRNQAHGSPANLLDVYAAADVPETEMFHTDRDILVSKFASSAGHVTGKNLISAETGTWLSEHFTETLAAMKELQDDMFVAGVNHIFYHGAAYSPDSAPWPGWCFYAATEMNPRNPIWRDVPALNAYAARCQSILQSGKPDNDILLYWPIADNWHDKEGMVQPFTVHQREWLQKKSFGETAKRLWEHGWSFDYGSDRQLMGMSVAGKSIQGAGAAYATVVVPRCEHMPLETMKKLIRLASAGGTVIFENGLPEDVPGWKDFEARRKQLAAMTQGLEFTQQRVTQIASVGTGRIIKGELSDCLALAHIRREPMADTPGLNFIRRAVDGGHVYFIANHSGNAIDQWTSLDTAATGATILDPMSGRSGVAAFRLSPAGVAQAHLQLEAGESCFLRTSASGPVSGQAWSYWKPGGEPIHLTGTWDVKFLQGGPELPAGYQTETLGSWAAREDPESQRFGGTVRYTLKFDAKLVQAPQWTLDLGTVCQSARVRLNGTDLGTCLAAPFRVHVPGILPTGNLLEVEVTNLGANRIRDLDKRGVNWKYFNDANVVNIDYKPFDASNWPVTDSGLLGPVTLQPDVVSTGDESK